MKLNHPLMYNNITVDDKNQLIKFIKKTNVFTQSKNVKKFEKMWSKWLGVKYSVFVNSGSSANLITIETLKNLYGLGEIIVPTITWNSDINSVIRMGFKPVFVDIDLKNLSMSTNEILKKINPKTKAVFLTHVLGFNALSQNLIDVLKKKKIQLIEDVCESHGAFFKNKRLGCYGLISNFSFYYAHHLSTIEGGMVCTNNFKIYNHLLMLRSHGLLRETTDKNYKNKTIKKYKNFLSENFIFPIKGYNFRNTELGAVIGINQLKRLNKNNILRNRNFNYFLKNLERNKYMIKFDTKGMSNYALIIIFDKNYANYNFRKKFEQTLKKNKVEFRRGTAGGGNQLRQPYLSSYLKKNFYKKFKNTEYVHNFGYYLGNFPELSLNKIKMLCNLINKI
jgi:CDP-4-dehydro-6-deoxyglucose reductase, E1